MESSLTRSNALFWIWGAVTMGTRMNWESSGWDQPCREGFDGAGWAAALQEPGVSPNPILGCTKPSTTSQEKEIILLFSALSTRLGLTTEEWCEGPWMHPKVGNKASERAGRMRSSCGLWTCLVWRRGGWGWPCALEQLPEDGKGRGKCWVLLPGVKILLPILLKQGSWRHDWCSKPASV